MDDPEAKLAVWRRQIGVSTIVPICVGLFFVVGRMATKVGSLPVHLNRHARTVTKACHIVKQQFQGSLVLVRSLFESWAVVAMLAVVFGDSFFGFDSLGAGSAAQSE